MSKRFSLLALSSVLALSLLLAACGGGGAAPQEDAAPAPETQTEPEPEPEVAEPVELDADAILSIIERECPINLGVATDVKVSAEHDGTRTVTFGSEYGDFSYTVDVYTGEILERVEPEMTEEQKSDDPIENAINACFKSLDGYNGGAENIKVTISVADGVQIVNVTFDWDGQSWDMSYNTATGEVVQN